MFYTSRGIHSIWILLSVATVDRALFLMHTTSIQVFNPPRNGVRSVVFGRFHCLMEPRTGIGRYRTMTHLIMHNSTYTHSYNHNKLTSFSPLRNHLDDEK